ncbi:MAG: phosphoribosylamine--glycine ligase [Candidatus Puniceispirillales bacterium]
MNVLIIGGGGREHALAYAIGKSPLLDQLFVSPGNPGIAQIATCVPYTDEAALFSLIRQAEINLVVIGPEAPLVDGLADRLRQQGIQVFGPSQQAAMLEGSKAFARDFCDRHDIPQPAWHRFENSTDAVAFINAHPADGHVIKADGLAAGKGVVVADTKDEAIAAITSMLDDQQFGHASASIVIEERITGVEASLFAMSDGEHAIMIGTAQDYKRAGDGDTGPNTGGMGAVSPAPALDQTLLETAWHDIVEKVISGMKDDNMPYQGFLYAGLMITTDGPKVIEFNCRFGDPEAEVILPRLKSDLLTALIAATESGLGHMDLRFYDGAAVTVIMANGGYPGPIEAGGVITGLDAVSTDHDEHMSYVFHAGTSQKGDDIIATGGRVLAVTALGKNQAEARKNAYRHVDRISWPKVYYRTDIAT